MYPMVRGGIRNKTVEKHHGTRIINVIKMGTFNSKTKAFYNQCFQNLVKNDVGHIAHIPDIEIYKFHL